MKKRVVVVKKGAGAADNGGKREFAHASSGTRSGERSGQRNDRPRREPRQNYGSDDGYSYNPFAALLKR